MCFATSEAVIGYPEIKQNNTKNFVFISKFKNSIIVPKIIHKNPDNINPKKSVNNPTRT